jgi:hypothetical protein
MLAKLCVLIVERVYSTLFVFQIKTKKGEDLFMYCWERAEKWYPDIQIE